MGSNIKIQGENLEKYSISNGTSILDNLSIADLEKIHNKTRYVLESYERIKEDLLLYSKSSDSYVYRFDIRNTYHKFSLTNPLRYKYKEDIYKHMMSEFFENYDKKNYNYQIHNDFIEVYSKTIENMCDLVQWIETEILEPYINNIITRGKIKSVRGLIKIKKNK